MTAPTILITGANGFTGQHACEYFESRGYQVIAVVRKVAESRRLAGRTVQCELTNRERVAGMIRNLAPAYVLHLAGQSSVASSWEHPVECMEANVLATLYLVDELRKVKQSRILVVGSMLSYSMGQDPGPPHPYSLSKTLQMVAAQSWSQWYGQEVVIAQPSNLIGPGHSHGICRLLAERMLRQARNEHLPAFKLSSLVEERDFLDVRDAVRAYELILRAGKPGIVYPVASGCNRSIGDIVHTYEMIFSRKLSAEIGHIINYAAPKPPDISLLAELGWKQQIPFEQSVKDIIAFLQNDEPGRGDQ